MVAVPGFVAAIGSVVLGSIGVATASAGLIMAVGALTIGFVTYSAIRGAKLRDSGIPGAMNPQVLVRNATEPMKIVYGQALVSGPMAWMNSADLTAANSGLYVAVALTGHEINSFVGWYIDDKWIPIADIDTDANGSVDSGSNDGSVDSDSGHGYIPVFSGTPPVLHLRGHVGSTTQAADALLDSKFSLWTSAHAGKEVSSFVAIMDRIPNLNTWDNGAPNNISTVIQGKKVYDPRLDSTFTGTWGTGSGAHRVATPSTWEYSNNPALCLADYLIDEGLGAGSDFTSADIDYNSVAIAADDCDDLVAIPTSATEKRFTCNGVLSCLDTHRENIEKLLSCMAGTLQYVNGLWQIQAGVWPSSSSFALTESDLVGDITWRPQPERGERYNAVRGLYFDPTRDYKESAYLPVEDTSLQSARDDGLVLWKELDLAMTNSETMCQRLAMRMLEQASRPGICVFPMGYRGMDIAPGDRGTVTISELGWNAKSFRCIGGRHVNMVGVELVLKEDDSGAYADPAEGEYGTRTSTSEITFPQFVRDVQERPIEDDFVYVSAAELHRRWTKRQGGLADAEISLVTGITDVVGGSAVRFGNNSGNDQWWGALTDVLMPYDLPNSTYEVGVIVRRNLGSGLIYCGVEGVANDRVTMVNVSGSDSYNSQHYAAAAGAAPSSSWTTYRGYIRGVGSSPSLPANNPNSPTVMRTNTTFIRPNLIVNTDGSGSGVAGQMDVAGLWLKRLPTVGTPNIGEEAATSVYTETNDSATNIALAGQTIVSIENITETYDCTVFATLTFDVDSDGDSGGFLDFWAEIDGVGIVATDPSSGYVMAATTDTRLTFQFQFDVSAGQTWNIFFEANSNVSAVVDVLNTRLEVNVIRR